MNEKLIRILRETFGLESFLPGQEAILESVLAGRDTLALLPTGGGKSLIYQMASQILPQTTVVVSPLLALVKDQVAALQSRMEARSEEEEIERGASKIVYVTPERFRDDSFLELLARRRVSLFVVDEAHCIVHWGHDFRPAYLMLGQAVRRLGRPTVLALTATAPPMLRTEIIENLGLRGARVVLGGVDRPNLFLEVLRIEEERDDLPRLRRLFEGEGGGVSGGRPWYSRAVDRKLEAAMHGSGIVYCATTAKARESARFLQHLGVSADYYHGRRRKADRLRVQDRFMEDSIRVVCATNAFGLGIDKPDIRFVIHRDVPASIEQYYQEAGRAGRDGGFARCTLLYRAADLEQASFLAATAEVTEGEIAAVLAVLSRRSPPDLAALAAEARLSEAKAGAVAALLQRRRALRAGRKGFQLAAERIDVEAMLASERRRQEYERSVRRMMARYAEGDECRRRAILGYFGAAEAPLHCDFCDNDLHKSPREKWREEREAARSPFTIGQEVVHPSFGRGTVQNVGEDTIAVLFADGYRTLDSRRVAEDGLLEEVGE